MEKDYKRTSQIINSCQNVEQLKACNKLLESLEVKYGYNKQLRELALQYLDKEKQLSPELLLK